MPVECCQEYLEACAIVTLMVGVWYVILSFIKIAEPLAILVSLTDSLIYDELRTIIAALPVSPRN